MCLCISVVCVSRGARPAGANFCCAHNHPAPGQRLPCQRQCGTCTWSSHSSLSLVPQCASSLLPHDGSRMVRRHAWTTTSSLLYKLKSGLAAHSSPRSFPSAMTHDRRCASPAPLFRGLTQSRVRKIKPTLCCTVVDLSLCTDQSANLQKAVLHILQIHLLAKLARSEPPY